KRNSAKKVKSSHEEIKKDSMKNVQMDLNMQINKMTSLSQQMISVTQTTTTNDQIREITSLGIQTITTNDLIETSTLSAINTLEVSTNNQHTLSRNESCIDNKETFNNMDVEEEIQQNRIVIEK
ncbi:15631_t:CDS:1, partial [Gigaspora rosea]